MNLDTLKLYCDVVRLRSFSRAAAANGITQSAASQSIQQLEGELDVPLLDRSRRPLVATKAGRVFFDACRGLIQGFDKARADLLASKQRVDGTVRVAAIYSVGLHDMSRHMQPFMSAHPQARVLLECLHPHKVVEAVLNDEADLGVLSYPTANRSLVEPRDLSGEKFVAFDRDLAVRRAIDRALRQHGVKVDVVMEFDNVETIKQAIGIAAGVSILPRPTVVMESGMRTLATVPLALPGLARPIGIIYRRGKQMPPAVSRFIEVLRRADGGQGGEPIQASRDASRGSAGAIRGPADGGVRGAIRGPR